MSFLIPQSFIVAQTSRARPINCRHLLPIASKKRESPRIAAMDAAFVPPRIPSDAPRPGSRGHQTRRSTASTGSQCSSAGDPPPCGAPKLTYDLSDSTETVTTPPTSPDKLFFFEYSSPASSETSNESSIGCGDLEAKVPNCNLDASVSVAEGSQSSNQPQEGSVQPQPRIAKSRNSDPLQPLSKRINPGLAL